MCTQCVASQSWSSLSHLPHFQGRRLVTRGGLFHLLPLLLHLCLGDSRGIIGINTPETCNQRPSSKDKRTCLSFESAHVSSLFKNSESWWGESMHTVWFYYLFSPQGKTMKCQLLWSNTSIHWYVDMPMIKVTETPRSQHATSCNTSLVLISILWCGDVNSVLCKLGFGFCNWSLILAGKLSSKNLTGQK